MFKVTICDLERIGNLISQFAMPKQDAVTICDRILSAECHPVAKCDRFRKGTI